MRKIRRRSRTWIVLGLAAITAVSCAKLRTTVPKESAEESAAEGGTVELREAGRAASRYLRALCSGKDVSASPILFGKPDASAYLRKCNKGTILSEKKEQNEQGDLAELGTAITNLDNDGKAVAYDLARRESATALSSDPDWMFPELNADQIQKLLEATKPSGDAIRARFPVMARIARVGYPVYWSARNPVRLVLAENPTGKYTLNLRVFEVETEEATETRRWELKVLRIQSGGLDTDWKVLAAHDMPYD
jgi:hypothetical protein